MNLMSVYDRLPVFAQNMAFSYMGGRIQKTRFGAGFHQMLSEFESHEGWSRDQLLAWRDERLCELVRHCYDTVPHYRFVMDEGGIDPASIKTGEDLKRLPVITKADVKADPESFVSSKAKGMNLLHVHTSGTTGSGLQFESTVECQQAQFACFWRYYRKHGLDLDTWQAQFSSRAAVPRRMADPPFWRVDKPGRRYYMSAFHESPANMRAYYEFIRDEGLPWISGYPSLMVLLAQWMNERGLCYDFVRAVTCGAENLLDHQVAAMEKAFGVRPVQTYGQTENVAIFSTEPDGRILVDETSRWSSSCPRSSGGGVPSRRYVPVQLRHPASALRHWRRRQARRLHGSAPRGRVHRRAPGGLCLPSGWHQDRKARPRLQGHASFPGGADLPVEGLLVMPARSGGAVPMRGRREDSARGASRIHRRGFAGLLRVFIGASALEVVQAALCGVGSRQGRLAA